MKTYYWSRILLTNGYSVETNYYFHLIVKLIIFNRPIERLIHLRDIKSFFEGAHKILRYTIK